MCFCPFLLEVIAPQIRILLSFSLFSPSSHRREGISSAHLPRPLMMIDPVPVKLFFIPLSARSYRHSFPCSTMLRGAIWVSFPSRRTLPHLKNPVPRNHPRMQENCFSPSVLFPIPVLFPSDSCFWSALVLSSPPNLFQSTPHLIGFFLPG